MKVRTIRKTSSGTKRNIYRETEALFTRLWGNIFLKPFVFLFFLGQIVLALFVDAVVPLNFISLGYNGWAILIYEAVVLYVSFLVVAFWFRAYDSV